MIKVAITGNIAAGKSSVERALEEKSYKVLDADCVAHDLLNIKSVEDEIIKAFEGYDVSENGKISRQKLGLIVFGDKEETKKLRKMLEGILHPKIKDTIVKFFEQNSDEKIVFVSVPLLFEAKFENLFDKVILVYSDDNIRIERLINRDNLPLGKDVIEYAKARLNSQMSQDKKISLADYVIYNNEDLPALNFAVNEIEEKILG